MRNILVVGIGPGNPEQITVQAIKALNRADVLFVPRKGADKADLAELRREIIARYVTNPQTRVVEFNARFGDPETQVVLARLATPLAGVLHAAATGRLGAIAPLEWLDDAAVTVVIAAHGYPADPRSGDPITGIEDADALPGVHVLHAGTALVSGPDGDQLVAAGGRVLSVVGVGADLTAARAAAYAGVERIALPGSHHRTDVALLAD